GDAVPVRGSLPRCGAARPEADEVRQRPLPEHRTEAKPGNKFARRYRLDAHVPAWPGRLPERLDGEMALGVAERLGPRARIHRLTHLSSSAVLSTCPIRRMPSSMSSSATLLYEILICVCPSSSG